MAIRQAVRKLTGSEDSMQLVKLTRNTRGKGSRPVEFLGILTELQARSEDGTPLFTERRIVKKTGEVIEPEPIMVPVNPNTLPDMNETIAGIVGIRPNVDELKFTFAKAYNAVSFQIEVDKTSTTVASILDPLFVEFGITDADTISTMKRSITSWANKSGKDPLDVGRLLLSMK
jgi:hypothetical protein